MELHVAFSREDPETEQKDCNFFLVLTLKQESNNSNRFSPGPMAYLVSGSWLH